MAKEQASGLVGYCDPASISAGVAFFSGRRLVRSAALKVDKKLSVFQRLHQLEKKLDAEIVQLVKDGYFIKEFHIEQLVRTTHIFTHWSVGVLGTTAAFYDIAVDADIPIKSWEKFANWHKERPSWVKAYQKRVETEDELAAICMGYWHTRRKHA